VDDEASRWPNEFEGRPAAAGWLIDGRIATPLPLPNICHPICHPSAMLLAAPSLLHASIVALLSPAL